MEGTTQRLLARVRVVVCIADGHRITGGNYNLSGSAAGDAIRGVAQHTGPRMLVSGPSKFGGGISLCTI